MAEQSVPGTCHHVEDEPECFIEDGITINETVSGIEPIPRVIISDTGSPRGDSGYFDVAMDSNVRNLNGLDLNQAFKSEGSCGLELSDDEEFKDDKELKEKTEIVALLRKRIDDLTCDTALCKTLLSEELAAKQEVFDKLTRQVQKKRGRDWEEKFTLIQIRRDREQQIALLNEKLLSAKQLLEDCLSDVEEQTKKLAKHLNSINSSLQDLNEKYDDIKTEIMKLQEQFKSLSEENQQKREEVSKHKMTLRRTQLKTIKRLAELAEQIDKKNAVIAGLEKKLKEGNVPSNPE